MTPPPKDSEAMTMLDLINAFHDATPETADAARKDGYEPPPKRY